MKRSRFLFINVGRMNRLLFVFLGFISEIVIAQPNEYSLSRCIDIAHENISVRIGQNALSIAEKEVVEVKDVFLPTISFANQHNYSIGRVLDPTTYQFVTNRTVYDHSASIGGSMTIFSGFSRVHQIKRAEQNLLSVKLDIERIGNDLSLEVTRLFLQLLMDRETVEICKNKLDLLNKQEALIAKKVEFETATLGDLLNIQADITRAQVEQFTAINVLNQDKVAMCELLEIDDWQQFDVAYNLENEVEPRLWCAEEVLSKSQSLPQVLQKHVAVEIAKRDVQIATSSFWPTIKLNAGYGSTYSNARHKATGEEYSFFDQLKDNRNSYVSVTLSIPLLSVINVSHTVKAKKYAVHSSELELERLLLSVDKEIKQAIIQVNTAYEKYLLLAKEVTKETEALRQTEAKFNAGAATYYDYQIAVGNLFQAQAERLQARFEYIYRTKVLDYYSGSLL